MSDENFVDIFEEPEDFRPPPPKSYFVTYNRHSIDLKTGKEKKSKEDESSSVKLRIIGSSPLWGHYLWNAGKYTAEYIDEHPELVKGKNVLELGAASGLPSIISLFHAPKMIVCTDYPDAELVDNIRFNFELVLEKNRDWKKIVAVKGYIWGNDYEPLLNPLDDKSSKKFDFIILSDLVFNHTEHRKLLKVCQDLLSPNGKCFVVFSPHRPKLLIEDLQFFELAEEYGFKVEKNDLVNWTPMFKEDEETVEIRSRVYSYWLSR